MNQDFYQEETVKHEPNNSIFEGFDNQRLFSDSQLSVERLNDLFQRGNITAKEHSFLMRKIYPVEKKTSLFALACFLIAALNWVLMLKFTAYGEVY